MKHAMIIIGFALLATCCAAQICGPYHVETSFTDADWGLTGATLRFWNCDGVQWLSISGSTTGGNGSFLLVDEEVDNGVTTRRYASYTPGDLEERDPGITLESGTVTSIFVVDEDGTAYIVYY